MAKGNKHDWVNKANGIKSKKDAINFAQEVEQNIQSYISTNRSLTGKNQPKIDENWVTLLPKSEQEQLYKSFLDASAKYTDFGSTLQKKIGSYVSFVATLDNFFDDAAKTDKPKAFAKKWNNYIQWGNNVLGNFSNQALSNNFVKTLDTTKATNLFNNLQEYAKTAPRLNTILADIDGKNAAGNNKYNVFDNVLNSYRTNQLANKSVASVLQGFSDDAMKKAYINAGLADQSLKSQVINEITTNQKNYSGVLQSLTSNDKNIIDALYEDSKSKDFSNLSKNSLPKEVQKEFLDRMKNDFAKTDANGKLLLNSKARETVFNNLIQNKLVTKTDTELLNYLANTRNTGGKYFNNYYNNLDAEAKEAFNDIMKQRALDPNNKYRIGDLDYLVKNKLISSDDAQLINTLANDNKNLGRIRAKLQDPKLQEALDNNIVEKYAASNWDSTTDPDAKIYKDYLTKNAPERLSSIDTLTKLAGKDTNGNVDVEGLKKKVAAISDPTLKAEMEQRIADASDLTKNPLKPGETNPFAEYEFNNNKNYAHRQAYLDSLDASQVMDNQGNLKNGWDQKGLTADEIKSIRARATLDPAIAHPHLEGWKQARQSLADAFTNPGNTDLGKIYGGVKQGIFGKPSSSGQGNGNVDVSGWKNFVKTGLVGLPVGLGVEYGINSPIREAMGGGNTGNRGLDALTDALTNPYTGIINSALVGGGTQGFAEAAGNGLGNRLAAGGIGAVKYGLSPRSLGLAGAMAGLNQLRDAENISSNNALWQAASTAAPWVQLGGAGTKIFGGNWMALPALTAAATAAVSNAAMNAQTERLGMRDTGRRYAAGEDMVGKDIDNYKGYVFLGRDGKAKDIYQIQQEMIAKGYAPSDAQDYIDTNYMAYTPEFVKGIMNNHVNKKKDWMERVERALTFYDKDGNPTGRIRPADETGNHLTDTLDYAQKMATASIANDGILGGLARMGKLAMLGAEGAWNELARGNTMEYKNGDPKRAMENWFAYNKQAMNKQAKEAKAQQPKATSVKQEAEQQAAAQEAAQQEAAQTVAAIQQAQQAYQTPQVGINLASLTPMGGQNASGIDDLLAMYNMQHTPQGMPNLANFA